MYITFQIITVIMGKNIQSVALKDEEINLSFKTNGLIIRNEHLIKSDIGGEYEILVEEGKKIKKNQDVINIYNSNKLSSDEIDKKIIEIKQEISKLENGQNNRNENKIVELNEKIDLISKDIRVQIKDKNYDVEDKQEKLNTLIEEKENLLNTNSNQAKVKSKEDELEILVNQKNKNIYSQKSDIAGIVSYSTDNKESIYTYNSINNITHDDIENESDNYSNIEKKGSIKEDEVLMRIVDNSNFYIAISVNDVDVEKFEVEQSIKINNNGNLIDGKIDQIYQNEENFIVIIKISTQNMAFFDTRVKEFDIIYKTVEGFKIPKSSFKEVDNKNGIYRINQENNKPEFIEVKKVESEDEDFKYISSESELNVSSKLNSFDEVILRPNFININLKIE